MDKIEVKKRFSLVGGKFYDLELGKFVSVSRIKNIAPDVTGRWLSCNLDQYYGLSYWERDGALKVDFPRFSGAEPEWEEIAHSYLERVRGTFRRKDLLWVMEFLTGRAPEKQAMNYWLNQRGWIRVDRRLSVWKRSFHRNCYPEYKCDE